MGEFIACGACRCLVKKRERVCPFCDAPVVSLPSRAQPMRRVSRSAWMTVRSASMIAVGTAASALVAAACNGRVEGDEPGLAQQDASAKATADASHDAEPSEPRAVAFACGPHSKCLSTTQYCVYERAVYAPCSGASPSVTEAYGCRDLGYQESVVVKAKCPVGPTCECERNAGIAAPSTADRQDRSAAFECDPSGYGWIATVTTTTQGGCGCYGCPPPRPDRLLT